jgi:hypothetical protein
MSTTTKKTKKQKKKQPRQQEAAVVAAITPITKMICTTASPVTVPRRVRLDHAPLAA